MRALVALGGPAPRSAAGAKPALLLPPAQRLVFVSTKGPDAESGLQAFELPLAYIAEESFNQPIFGANNLRGKCALVEGGSGGGAGSAHSVEFALYFKDGGCGTFIPIFYRDLAYIRSVAGRAAATAEADCPRPAVAAQTSFNTAVATAVVDPNDPSVVYLMSQQPVGAEQQLKEAPKWAQGSGDGGKK